jgi:hypothetical protein
MTIVTVKRISPEDGSTGSPVNVTYSNGDLACFNLVEGHPMYDTIMEQVAAGTLTIQDAD